MKKFYFLVQKSMMNIDIQNEIKRSNYVLLSFLPISFFDEK